MPAVPLTTKQVATIRQLRAALDAAQERAALYVRAVADAHEQIPEGVDVHANADTGELTWGDGADTVERSLALVPETPAVALIPQGMPADRMNNL